MKKTKILLVIALAVITVAGCKKNEEDATPKSKMEILTSGSWITTDQLFDGLSVWSFVSNCEKDDFYTLKTGGTGTFDEGATKCDPSDPQTTSATWSLSADQTKLTLDGEEGVLAELTETTMRITYADSGSTAEIRLKKK